MTCLCGREGCHEEEPVQTRPTREPDKDGQMAEKNPRRSPEDSGSAQKTIHGGPWNSVVPRFVQADEGYGQIVVESYDRVNKIREFETGATRDTDEGKLDYEGFLAPAVLERYAQYMHRHRQQSDGTFRASDNWQKGMPQEQYLKSLIRHVVEFWKINRSKVPIDGDPQEIACAIMFNIMGWLYEDLK